MITVMAPTIEVRRANYYHDGWDGKIEELPFVVRATIERDVITEGTITFAFSAEDDPDYTGHGYEFDLSNENARLLHARLGRLLAEADRERQAIEEDLPLRVEE